MRAVGRICVDPGRFRKEKPSEPSESRCPPLRYFLPSPHDIFHTQKKTDQKTKSVTMVGANYNVLRSPADLTGWLMGHTDFPMRNVQA